MMSLKRIEGPARKLECVEAVHWDLNVPNRLVITIRGGTFCVHDMKDGSDVWILVQRHFSLRSLSAEHFAEPLKQDVRFVSTIANHPNEVIFSFADSAVIMRGYFPDGDSISCLCGHSAHLAPITASLVCPTGHLLATGDKLGNIQICSLDCLYRTANIEKAHNGPVVSILWMISGTTLITGSFDGFVRIWSVSYGELSGISAHLWRAMCLQCADVLCLSGVRQSGCILVSAGTSEGTIYLWNIPECCSDDGSTDDGSCLLAMLQPTSEAIDQLCISDSDSTSILVVAASVGGLVTGYTLQSNPSNIGAITTVCMGERCCPSGVLSCCIPPFCTDITVVEGNLTHFNAEEFGPNTFTSDLSNSALIPVVPGPLLSPQSLQQQEGGEKADLLSFSLPAAANQQGGIVGTPHTALQRAQAYEASNSAVAADLEVGVTPPPQLELTHSSINNATQTPIATTTTQKKRVEVIISIRGSVLAAISQNEWLHVNENIISDKQGNTLGAFDRVLVHPNAACELYNEHYKTQVEQLVHSPSHLTILACGPSGGGKTFLTNHLVQLFLSSIFSGGGEVHIQLFEIYQDKARDLLLPGKGSFYSNTKQLSTILVSSAAAFKRLWDQGVRNRAQSSTGLNTTSSRSHAILKVMINNNSSGSSSITVIDLAGSECHGDTQANAKQRLEANFNNTSLLALTNLIRGLAKQKHGEFNSSLFRGCMLTRVLQTPLGAKISNFSVVCCLRPEFQFHRQTMQTLHFATSCKALQSKVRRHHEEEDTVDIEVPASLLNSLRSASGCPGADTDKIIDRVQEHLKKLESKCRKLVQENAALKLSAEQHVQERGKHFALTSPNVRALARSRSPSQSSSCSSNNSTTSYTSNMSIKNNSNKGKKAPPQAVADIKLQKPVQDSSRRFRL